VRGETAAKRKIDLHSFAVPEPSPAPAKKPRDTLRDVQKRRTRRKLLAAGKKLFAHGGYMICRVDEIAAEAGISRAAFYLHYKSKRDLLGDILEHETKWQWRRHRSLKSTGAPSADELVAWIESFVRGFAAGRDTLSLFNFAASIDHSIVSRIYANRQQFALLLSRQVPAFNISNAGGEVDIERHATLLLLLFELEQLCVQVAQGYWPTDPKIAIHTLASRFLDFSHFEPVAG
jgi:AcrR family transcriptional regulator